jgi:hypothetical protein
LVTILEAITNKGVDFLLISKREDDIDHEGHSYSGGGGDHIGHVYRTTLGRRRRCACALGAHRVALRADTSRLVGTVNQGGPASPAGPIDEVGGRGARGSIAGVGSWVVSSAGSTGADIGQDN